MFFPVVIALFLFISEKLIFSASRRQQGTAQTQNELSRGPRVEPSDALSREDVERLIRQEVQKQFEQYAAAQASNPKTSESIVHDVFAQIRTDHPFLDDRELDRYVAGEGIEPAIPAAPATFSDPTDERLVQNEQKISEDITGGAAAEQPESIERTLQQKGSILLPRHTLQVEPSFTYAHFSSNRINIQGFSILPVLVIGDISTQEVNRDIFIETLTFKYGLFNNFQTELKLPYRGEYDRVSTSANTETTRHGSGLGDIEFGASRQIGWEDGLMPDLVAAVNIKSPTGREPYNHDIALGTGHWAMRGALIAAKASDPAVVFGGVNYTYNFGRQDIENFGDIKPGNSAGYSFGTAVALSYQVALNFSFDHSVTFKTEREGRFLTDSFLNVMNFKTGLTWAIDERKSLDISLTMGLTKDAPDAVIEVRFPITF